MKKIEVSISGGFHNVDEFFVMVPFDCINHDHFDVTKLSDKQRRALDKIVCGIKNCDCGGIYRAKIKLKK